MNFFKKIKNKIIRFRKNRIAKFIAKTELPMMEKFGFKNVRVTLGKHNGLWVVAFLCTDYPFGKDSPLNFGDNCIAINGLGECDLHASQQAHESSHR